MTTLLHIDASIKGDASTSRAVTQTFRKEWDEQHPGSTVIYRDLALEPLPHLSGDEWAVGAIPPADRTPEQQATFAFREKLITELESADAVLIGAPLYNYTIPSALKAWVDFVLLPGRTALNEQPTAAGTPVTVVTSRGGSYAPGAPMEGKDFVQPYFEWVLGGVLKLDVTFIVPELTLAPVNPQMANLIDQYQASLDRAHEEARASAKRIASQLAGKAS